MSGGVHILLIDDHALFRESLVRLLAVEAGLNVVGHCATIAEARRIMSETSVDVVLLDYDLGEESGTDLLKYLHQTESKARVLVLTDWHESERHADCLGLRSGRCDLETQWDPPASRSDQSRCPGGNLVGHSSLARSSN